MPELPPLRVAHLADTHLGYRQYAKLDPESERNQRAVDIERAFTAAIDAILAAAPDLVIHAGDVFHHTRPTWPAMRVFVQQMRRLEQAGIPVVIIAGNHDVPRVRTAGTVFSLLEMALPEVRFAAGYESQRIGFRELGLAVAAIPHGAISLDAAGPAAYPVAGYRNILVAHGVIPGMADLTHVEPGEEEISDTLLDTGFDYIALGHIHAFKHVRANAWYSGATERTGWGEEAATPGWTLVEFAAGPGLPTVTHQPVPARPMHTLPPFSAGDLPPRALADHILERAGRLGDPTAMVRIELREITRGIRREVDAIVKREAAAVAWQIDIRQPGGVGAFLGDRPTATGDTINPLALFDAFVDERAAAGIYDARFAAAFRDRGRAALERAAQDDLQQSAEVAE